jgi:hypothetical protein
VHRNHDYCEVAQQLCGLPVLTTNKTCEACDQQKRPQEKNIVTCGIAFLAIQKSGRSLSEFPEIEQEINDAIKAKKPETNPGPSLWRELFLTIETERQLIEWESRIPNYQCGGKCKKFYLEWKTDNLPEFPLSFRWKWKLKNAVNAKLGQKIMSHDDALAFWSSQRRSNDV